MNKKRGRPKKKQLKSLNEYLYNAIDNLENDRSAASVLLNSLMVELKKDPSKHEKSGIVAAKYLETLQRSNEQLVKALEFMRKSKDEEDNFGQEDIESVYDELQGE